MKVIPKYFSFVGDISPSDIEYSFDKHFCVQYACVYACMHVPDHCDNDYKSIFTLSRSVRRLTVAKSFVFLLDSELPLVSHLNKSEIMQDPGHCPGGLR